MRSGLVIVLAIALVGCGSNDDPSAPTRNETAGVDPNARPVFGREVRSGWASTPAPEPMVLDQPPPPPPPDVVVEEQVVITPEVPAEVRPRNYGNDLRDAIGDISGCLDVQTAARVSGALSVSVSATALPSGRLQRASVSGGSLPRATTDCIRARVEAASLAQPIEGAPRTVATTLRYEVSAQVTTETRTRFADDEAPPGNTQAPGVVLPALAPPGAAPGAQAPAYTQPALAPSGPAPGAVAPAYTLPAQVPSTR